MYYYDGEILVEADDWRSSMTVPVNVTTRAVADERLLAAADRAELLGKGHFHCCDAPV